MAEEEKILEAAVLEGTAPKKRKSNRKEETCAHCGSKKDSGKNKLMKAMITKAFWKSKFSAVLYFCATILCIHDIILVVLHTISPKIAPWATPFFLDKLFTSLIQAFAF